MNEALRPRQRRAAAEAALLDAVAEPVLVTDAAGRVLRANAAAEALFGPAGGLAGTLDPGIPDAPDSGSGPADRVLATLRGERRFVVARRAAGANFVLTFRDVTELRRAETALRDRAGHMRGLLDLHPVVPFSFAPDGRLSFPTARLAALTGLPPETARVEDWWRAMHPEDRREATPLWEAAVAAGGHFDVEHRLPDRDGRWRWFRVRAVPRRDGAGRIDRWFGLLEDVHDRRTAVERLSESEARFRAFADDAPVMIWVTDVRGKNTFVSRAWCDNTGQTVEEALGDGWLACVHPDDRAPASEVFAAALERRRAYSNEYRMRSRSGHWSWVIDVGRPRFLADGSFAGYIGCCVDINARRKAEDDRVMAQLQVFHMARHDMLTGLPNRHHFAECYQEAVAELAPGRSVAVLMLDLDGFKAVNDTRGHPAGDLLLRQVADRLRMGLRSTDTVARLGGDEFAVIQTPVRSDEDACELARRLIAALSQPYDLDGMAPVIGASVGVAFARSRFDPADEVMRLADVALYAAKQAGRGTFRVFDSETDVHLQTRQKMKAALRNAMAEGELSAFFQPLVGLASGHVTACEALMRWHHPGVGWVPPDEFIPVAEEAGLIGTMGRWMLHSACAEAVRWPEEVAVAVNLSPLQFRSGGLVEDVVSALAAAGLPAARLQLEITESVLLDPTDRNLGLLQQLRGIGVRIVMDDFGTGYSSLGYLRSFPFDKIKIDRSFIRDLPDAREARAILKAVAGLGRSLNMRTTVEGVETEAQLAAAAAEGVDEAQGYLFSRPLPAGEVAAFIASRNVI